MPRPSTLKESPALRKDPFFTIGIKHLPTGKVVSFEGWVTEFSDQYNSNWSEQTVYGRMDPLATFENTQRTITLAFDVVSDNVTMAAQNLANINYLIEFLYPMYENSSGFAGARGLQTTIQAAPLLGIQWTNLISNSSSPGYLYGYIKGGLSYAPEIGEGGFIRKDTSSTTETEEIIVDDEFVEGESTTVTTKKNSFIPKKVSLSFSFSVLHTHLTGWQKGSNFSTGMAGTFPNAVFLTSKSTVITDQAGEVQNPNGSGQILVNEALVLEEP
jgi:hypothetical protein